MKIGIIVTIVFLSLLGILCLYCLIGRKKALIDFMNKVRTQLLEAGIEATASIDKNHCLEKLKVTVKKLDKDIDCVCEVKGQDFDYLCSWVHAGPNSSLEAYFHYLVIGESPEDKAKNTRTSWIDKLFVKRFSELHIKKGILPWGKVSSILWRGDTVLSTRLNADTVLTENIMQLILRKKHPRKIFIQDRDRYAIIGTDIYNLEPEDFEIINRIARHIKAAWFGGSK
jgi:hypothetical protein